MPSKADPSWEDALPEFQEPWRASEEVEGVVVTGSRVFGTATPRSDVDVHIVLVDGTGWRERGNRMIIGFLVEYFANPVAQIRKYMEEDELAGRRTDARMLALGRIVLELQRRMQAATPCSLVVSMDTGHSPFFAAPVQLANHLMAVAGAYGSRADGVPTVGCS